MATKIEMAHAAIQQYKKEKELLERKIKPALEAMVATMCEPLRKLEQEHKQLMKDILQDVAAKQAACPHHAIMEKDEFHHGHIERLCLDCGIGEEAFLKERATGKPWWASKRRQKPFKKLVSTPRYVVNTDKEFRETRGIINTQLGMTAVDIWRDTLLGGRLIGYLGHYVDSTYPDDD